MDPATIALIVQTGAQIAVELAGVVGNEVRKKWTSEGWHGLSQIEKEAFVHKMLDYAFSNACKIKASPKEIFWEMIRPNIFRVTEQNYGAWFMKNQWLINPEFIPYYEQKYGILYGNTPQCTLTQQLKANQKFIIYTAIALAAIFIIYNLIKK